MSSPSSSTSPNIPPNKKSMQRTQQVQLLRQRTLQRTRSQEAMHDARPQGHGPLIECQKPSDQGNALSSGTSTPNAGSLKLPSIKITPPSPPSSPANAASHASHPYSGPFCGKDSRMRGSSEDETESDNEAESNDEAKSDEEAEYETDSDDSHSTVRPKQQVKAETRKGRSGAEMRSGSAVGSDSEDEEYDADWALALAKIHLGKQRRDR